MEPDKTQSESTGMRLVWDKRKVDGMIDIGQNRHAQQVRQLARRQLLRDRKRARVAIMQTSCMLLSVVVVSALVPALSRTSVPSFNSSVCDSDDMDYLSNQTLVDDATGDDFSMTRTIDVESAASGLGGIPTPPQTEGVGQCRAELGSPVIPQVVLRKFDAPRHAWGSGHRGADLVAVEGTPLFAPANGVISFAGLVAEKSVVSIRYRALTLTFEPAQTELPIGTPVVRGMPFAVVAGLSDHCTGACVHWGVRKIQKRYVDPVKRTEKRKIVLKPVD